MWKLFTRKTRSNATMKQPLAVVLVSGGMDSCVTAAIAHQQYIMAFLHLNYGQKTEQRELQAFHDIADFYSVQKRLVIDASFFRTLGGSSLTDDAMPVEKAQLDSQEIPSSYVPFRNGNILAMATSYAERIAAETIFIGAVEEDASGYPDCREDFFKAFNSVIRLGTRPDSGIRIRTPIIGLKKKDIIRKGLELGAPLSKTWSCYQNEDRACGECDSCALRLRGFRQAGVEDPIPYRKKIDYSAS
jgi:7-cyano-7-deazaguanine synthase